LSIPVILCVQKPASGASAEVLAVHHAEVEEIMDMLRLRECADTYVGNELLRGISGGQKKRFVFSMWTASCKL
jgi:ABC-type multidrug transport system ATPase subunit